MTRKYGSENVPQGGICDMKCALGAGTMQNRA